MVFNVKVKCDNTVASVGCSKVSLYVPACERFCPPKENVLPGQIAAVCDELATGFKLNVSVIILSHPLAAVRVSLYIPACESVLVPKVKVLPGQIDAVFDRS
jgi:hypothetical protein